MSRRVWEAVESKAREVRMAKAEEERKKKGKRKEAGREKTKMKEEKI